MQVIYHSSAYSDPKVGELLNLNVFYASVSPLGDSVQGFVYIKLYGVLEVVQKFRGIVLSIEIVQHKKDGEHGREEQYIPQMDTVVQREKHREHAGEEELCNFDSFV